MKYLSFLITLLLFGCGSNQTGIEGDSNDNNTIVVGDGNIVHIPKENRPIEGNLSVSMTINNDSLEHLITKAREEEGEFFNTSFDKITYVINENSDYIDISPTSEYYEEFYNQMKVSDARLFYTLQPTIDFKVLNNSDESIFFNKAEIQVIESRLDKLPFFWTDAFSTANITVVQENWIPIKKIKFSYNICHNENECKDKTTYKYETTIAVNTLDDIIINLDKGLQGEGLNMNILNHIAWQDGLKYKDSNSNVPDEILSTAFGSFSYNIDFDKGIFPSVYVRGLLEYQYEDENNNTKTKIAKVGQSIDIIEITGKGANVPISFAYHSNLKYEGNNYNIVTNLSQALKPQEFDRFTISLGADKSSNHILKINLYNNDKLVYTSKPIKLRILKPRNVNND